MWDWCGLVGDKGDRAVEPGDRLRETRCFPDARLNFAENLPRPRAGTPAIIARNEAGRHRELSWRELHDLTSRLAQAMRAAGVQPGDRIALLPPNIPEAVAVALAAASIGAVTSSASPDSILLYDGSPVHPTTTTLFEFAEAAGNDPHGHLTRLPRHPPHLPREPAATHDLSTLRTIISTPTAPRSLRARASWCARGRFRRCRSAF